MYRHKSLAAIILVLGTPTRLNGQYIQWRFVPMSSWGHNLDWFSVDVKAVRCTEGIHTKSVSHLSCPQRKRGRDREWEEETAALIVEGVCRMLLMEEASLNKGVVNDIFFNIESYLMRWVLSAELPAGMHVVVGLEFQRKGKMKC